MLIQCQGIFENFKLIIPKTLNFVWLSKDRDSPPKKYSSNIKSFMDANPDFEIDSLVQTHLPEYFEKYSKIPYLISKCDFVLYTLMVVYMPI